MSKMPVIFVGHGSPMNAVEDNDFTSEWRLLGTSVPQPRAILCISAHWYVKGTKVSSAEQPKQIYDMYGFPPELYKLKYPATGYPALAKRAMELLPGQIEDDRGWGIDHGAWSVLVHMFPAADIPIVQLSVNRAAPSELHFKLGSALKPLREEGFLILASGNVVHNLAHVNWSMAGGFDWALGFDERIKNKIYKREYQDVIDYAALSSNASLAVPTPDHFIPLLYALGASDPADTITVFNESCVLGSLSMTGYVFG